MKPPEKLTWEDVERVLAAWLEILGLQQWEIKCEDVVRPNPTDDLARSEDVPGRCDAEIDRQADYKAARIWLAPDFRHWTLERLNRTICHELMHCVFREIEWTTDLLTNRVPDEAKSFFDGAFGHALEGTIEHLSRTFVDEVGVQ